MKTQIGLTFLGITALTFFAVLVVTPFVLANSKSIQDLAKVKVSQTKSLSLDDTGTILLYDTSCERAEVLLVIHFPGAWQNH